MKVLVIGHDATDGYPGVFCSNFRRALDFLGIEFDHVLTNANLLDHPGYDIYIGVGDELLRRLPEQVANIKSMGGTAVDIRTKKLPNKPKTWFKSLVGDKKYQVDHVLTHMEDRRKNCFHIGHGLNESLLYPEQDDIFTVYVDHWFPRRNAQVQKILDQCKLLHDSNRPVRIWYHNSEGIVENIFEEDAQQYKSIPFSELSAFYRKTHVFLPTHRETQGIVAAEIGMCGGLTMLQPWMYPKKTIKNIPHKFYRRKIKWPETVDFKANMALTRERYGFEAFALRIKFALEQIGAERRRKNRVKSIFH